MGRGFVESSSFNEESVMNEQYSIDELVAAYLLHKVFVGEELQRKMEECGLREAVLKLSTNDLKDLLNAYYGGDHDRAC
jgi:hypothetical protein